MQRRRADQRLTIFLTIIAAVMGGQNGQDGDVKMQSEQEHRNGEQRFPKPFVGRSSRPGGTTLPCVSPIVPTSTYGIAGDSGCVVAPALDRLTHALTNITERHAPTEGVPFARPAVGEGAL